MKTRGTISVILLGLVLIMATACGSNDKEVRGQQTGEGETNVTVTADGNLEASQQLELTFNSGGKVEKIHVRQGDKVSKGDILAELDTGALELALTQAKVAWAEAEVAVERAKAGVTQAQAGVTQAQVTLANAEISLEFARKSYSVSDIKVAEANVDINQRNFDEALWVFAKYDQGTPGYDKYQEVLLQAEAGLKAAKDTLDGMLNGFDVKEVASKKLQVEADEKSVELSEQNLKVAEKSLALAEQSLEYARQSVDLAQKKLDEATITAPFDGTIYKIGAKEGEFISSAAYSGAVIIGIVDLAHMELVASVDELDIVKIKTGQRVMINLDALPDLQLEGKVIFISTVASEPEGLLLFEDDDELKKYEVKIEFDTPKGMGIRSGMSSTFDIIVE